MSYFVLKHSPKGSPRSGPDVLLTAVCEAIHHLSDGDGNVDMINLHIY